jgi:5'-methylthioadenosine phosphorylase
MKLGIIGGSGIDNPQLIENYEEIDSNTPYGKPSSRIICGKINNIDVCILSRHGRDHEIPPSQINFRANIYALKNLGCTHILATNSVGSLKEWIKPGDIVLPDQFIDFTKHRFHTFYDKPGNVIHPEMSEPFSKELRQVLTEKSYLLDLSMHDEATILVIEGPRYSTKAESMMFQNHADVIGMTTVPECILARELGIEYATIAMITDYDCWKKGEEPVNHELVVRTMQENAEKVKKLLLEAISYFSEKGNLS